MQIIKAESYSFIMIYIYIVINNLNIINFSQQTDLFILANHLLSQGVMF